MHHVARQRFVAKPHNGASRSFSTIAHSCSKTQTSSAGRSIAVCKYFISRFALHSGGICQAQNSGSDSLIESTVCGNASAKAENKKQGPPL